MAEIAQTVEFRLLILTFLVLAGPILAERLRLPGLVGLVFLGMVFGPWLFGSWRSRPRRHRIRRPGRGAGASRPGRSRAGCRETHQTPPQLLAADRGRAPTSPDLDPTRLRSSLRRRGIQPAQPGGPQRCLAGAQLIGSGLTRSGRDRRRVFAVACPHPGRKRRRTGGGWRGGR